VLSLQSEVARAITDRIQVAVTSEERERLAREREVDPAAHDAFLRGQHLYWNGSEDATRRSMAYFRQAIDIDPTYAPAYAWLSFTYSRSAHFGFMTPEEAEPKAQAAASKALELDPSLADAHLAAGDYERALELNPNSVPALLKRMGALARSGRFDDSIEDAKRAIEIDPLTPYISLQLGWVYHFARRYDEAIAALKKTIEMDPTFFGPWEQLAWAYAGKGMYAEAIAAADTNLALNPNPMTDEITLGGMGRVYAVSGRPDKARELLRTLLDLRTREHVDAWYIAELYGGLGVRDSVFIWLNRAYDERSPSMKALRFEPWLLPLHDDPRYQDLERRYFGSTD
jgi:tetratricopeptide (TPR) repeat protein